MRSAVLLPTAAEEVRHLRRADQCRVLGAVESLQDGELEGEPCLPGEPAVIVRRLTIWQYVIIYLVMNETLYVAEVYVGLREAEDRADEVRDRIIHLQQGDDRHELLAGTLELLQSTG